MLSVCSQRLYLLKLLKQQGLPQNELNIVYNAIIVNRITYALPAWAGFMTADLTNRINKLLKKCFKFCYSKQCHNIAKLIEHADDKLFRSLRSPAHCAHYLLPPVKPAVRTLRPRGHNYILPECKYALYKNSFLCRYLYAKSSTRTNKI